MVLEWLVRVCDWGWLPPFFNIVGLGFDIIGATLVLVPDWRLFRWGIYGYGVPPYIRRLDDGCSRLTNKDETIMRGDPVFSPLLKMFREQQQRKFNSEQRERPTAMSWNSASTRQVVTVEYERGPDMEIEVADEELADNYETRLTNHYSAMGFVWLIGGFSLQIVATVLHVSC